MAQKSPRQTPGIRYDVLSTTHVDDLVDFLLDHFYSKVIWGVSLGLDPEKEVKPWLRPLMEYRLNLGFSVGAWDDDTNQLVGVASNELKMSNPSQLISQDQLVTPRYPKAYKNVELIRALHGGRDLLKMCQAQSFGRIAQLSVRSDYEGRGIASQLVARSEKLFLEKGVGFVYTETVNEFSAGLFQRKGYDVVAELPYADHKENGEVVFKDTGIHKTCRLFIKRLELS